MHIGRDFVCLTTLQSAFWSWLRHIKSDHEQFTCPRCGNAANAPILIIDGTSLSFPRRWQEQKLGIAVPVNGAPLQRKSGSRHTDRVLIPDEDTRELLRWFTGLRARQTKTKAKAIRSAGAAAASSAEEDALPDPDHGLNSDVSAIDRRGTINGGHWFHIALSVLMMTLSWLSLYEQTGFQEPGEKPWKVRPVCQASGIPRETCHPLHWRHLL